MRQVVEALARALEAAGITVVRSFARGSTEEVTAPVAAVGLEQAHSDASGQFSYLGMQTVDGGTRALYGRAVTAAIRIEAVAPRRGGSAACMELADAVVACLTQPVSGVQVTGFTVDACRYDAQSDCFCCAVTAQCAGYVYAVADEDETEFTDFILKGEAV